MDIIKNFDVLICGEPTVDMYDFQVIIHNLSNKIYKMTELIKEYNWNLDTFNIELPFYGRSVLETVFTTLLGRIDPYRLITVYKVQSDPSYDLGKKAQSAIEWTGDILAKNRDTNLWNFEKNKEKFDRALLGNYIGEIAWKPAFRALNDYIDEHNYGSNWLGEILSGSEEANFEKGKSMAGRLFSSFSKGVHSECLVDMDIMLDLVTLKSLIKDMYKLCATFGLISHFIGYMSITIEKERALSIFLDVEEMIENV